jgi:hypothetical protein
VSASRLLVASLLFLAACHPRVRYPDVQHARPAEPVVQLRRADVIFPFGEHYWFVWYDPDADRTWHRTELFARARDGRRVTTDRLPPDVSFDARFLRPARLVREFRGACARRLIGVIATSRETYPRQDRYVLTGPNSNTYIAWVLREARVGHDLSVRGVGRRFPARAGLSDSRTGLALHTPVLSLEVGALDGIEIGLGTATLGLDFWPPALKTPFGRLGWPEPSLRLGPRPSVRREQYRAEGEAVLSELGVTRDEMRARFRTPRAFDRWLHYRVRQRLVEDADPPESPERIP